MIERYTTKAMGKIWNDDNKYRTWMEIETLACEAMAELGKIPKEAAKNIREKADFEVERIYEVEAVTKHDVIAFLTVMGEHVGQDSKYIHYGMTSSDVLDTSLAVLMKQAGEIILADLVKLDEVLAAKAKEHKYTLMIGRTHGIHAEPITFGLKMALWVAENRRNIERMKRAIEIVSVGKISGAVGTFANIDPFVEEYVCRNLGLKPAEVSTQILQRDRHAEFMTTLAIIASSLDKFGLELRNLQRTDILEVEEQFTKGQKGSSAMPHKRNPITSERVCGLARVVRGNAMAALENVPLWHERDITHSSVERVIIPDSCIIMDYILNKFIGIVEGLNVYPENMKNNMQITGKLTFSQKIMLELVEKGGIKREEAYALVQRNALKAWEEKADFEQLVLHDQDIAKYLTNDQIEACFDYNYHIKNVDTIFKRLDL
ncbi:MAG: adenylosuccinate lyase [bacterium]